MSFDGIKDQLVARLGAKGYRESREPFDFENASPNEYGSTYIITPISGSMEDESETLVDRFYDVQLWQVQIAFDKSANKRKRKTHTYKRY